MRFCHPRREEIGRPKAAKKDAALRRRNHRQNQSLGEFGYLAQARTRDDELYARAELYLSKATPMIATARLHFILLAASKRPCLLCRRRPYVAALFFAHDQQRVFAPKGKRRGVAYTLCRKCSKRPDATERAETTIFREMAADHAAMN
jgi:hypothetical protein